MLALLVDWLAAVAISMGFFAYDPTATLVIFWAMTTVLVGTGFTIGQRVAGIRVATLDGRPVGLARAAVRTTALCLVVPAVVWGPDGRALHDRWAGTEVRLAR